MAYNNLGSHFDAAKQISIDDILSNLGVWDSRESIVDGIVVVSHSRTTRGKEVTIQSTYHPKTYEEGDKVQFVKGGNDAFPIHKFDFIRDMLCGGNELAAITWVSNNAPVKRSWLVDLGDLVKAEEGLSEPISDERNHIVALAARQVLRIKADELAKLELAEESFRREGAIPQPMSVIDWLQEPDQVAQFRIEELWVKGGNNFIVAPNKGGKTTLVLNVLKALVDGGLFLGKFNTLPVTRNVGIINFELSPSQYKRWIRKLELRNVANVKVWNLRGLPNPFRTPTSRAHFVAQLLENNIEVLIIDPFSSAFTGKNAKENEEVKEFLLLIDSLAAQGNVEEYLLVVHAGHDGTRARGASTLADHPDATWFIGKGEAGRLRTFRAEGRDVSYTEEAITLGVDGITLTLTGLTKADSVLENMKLHVSNFVGKNPNCMQVKLRLRLREQIR
ncbi:AAA family ATPase [Rhodoluna sp.]|uniref:AAA family ATPase n=1 Tax=Rhodoluna sp. TaxID=1969481 RepID=UPI0025F7A9E6|nr:AAA family ATPase [Rhodoluna sp.]